MVHFVGFSRQLESVDSSILSDEISVAVERGSNYPTLKTSSYLREGHPIKDILDSCKDVLDERYRIRGCSSVLSDGEWVWRWGLVHYVEKHNVQLPSKFVTHMEQNAYEVPSVAQRELIAITLEVNKALGFRIDPGAGARREPGVPGFGEARGLGM